MNCPHRLSEIVPYTVVTASMSSCVGVVKYGFTSGVICV
jgi:hypothetical protein